MHLELVLFLIDLPSVHSSTPRVLHLSDDASVSFGGGEKMAIYAHAAHRAEVRSTNSL